MPFTIVFHAYYTSMSPNFVTGKPMMLLDGKSVKTSPLISSFTRVALGQPMP